MSRRIGQNGAVEVRNGVYRGRYRVDVPEQHERVNKAVILGFVREMTKSEARRKLRSIIAQEGLNQTSYVIPSSELFERHVVRWRQNYLSRQKPSTQATMDYHIDKYLTPQWGKHPVDTIRGDVVNEWLGSLAHLAPSTQRGVVKTLQMALGKKFDKKLVHFPSKREARRQHPCHTPEQMQRITNAAREPYQTIFAVFSETRMRSGEVYGLRVEDIDLKRCLFTFVAPCGVVSRRARRAGKRTEVLISIRFLPRGFGST